MCQYSRRCPTGTHRPGTVCPYVGRGTSAVRTPSQLPAIRPPRSSRSTSAVSRYQRAALTTGGLSLADALAWWIWLAVFWEPHLDRVTLATILVAAGVPAGLATYWLARCSGWLDDGSRRCRQPRTGFLRRCAQHRNQVITWYDVAGGIAAVVAVFNLAALFIVG